MPTATTPWTVIDDYKFPGGWQPPDRADARARASCEALEAGEILFFHELPYSFPKQDREFLLAQKWAELRLHKNVSYRPQSGVLRGVSGDHASTGRLRD